MAALPFLKQSPRLSYRWRQRILRDAVTGPFDLWIQSASGGESMLTGSVLEVLADQIPGNKKRRILVTSGTPQGIDTLQKNKQFIGSDAPLDITVACFPFDAPRLMRRAFTLFAPKLAVLVETELWPGFLSAAKQQHVPVLLINGRMSEKSFRSNLCLAPFFKKFGPNQVFAVSERDGKRFSRLFGEKTVSLMNNIKFDRIDVGKRLQKDHAFAALIPPHTPFVLLGSIRRQEEEKILGTLKRIRAKRPDIVVGLFPKHVERADHWIEMLNREKIPSIKRSKAEAAQPAGSVIVWDVYGELAGAYALAKAAFVGGSLVDLGGQNFLEPLVFGLKPIIGPYWGNFAWVGQEVISSGLVRQVADEHELTAALIEATDAQSSKEEVASRVEAFFKPRQGGTLHVCREIANRFAAMEKE